MIFVDFCFFKLIFKLSFSFRDASVSGKTRLMMILSVALTKAIIFSRFFTFFVFLFLYI